MAKKGGSTGTGSAYASGTSFGTPGYYSGTVSSTSLNGGAGTAGSGGGGGGTVGTNTSRRTGAGTVSRSFDSVATVFDPVSGNWYYVRAESIDGQRRLKNSLKGGAAYAPGSPVTNALKDMNVEYVPAYGANHSGLNQQDVRKMQLNNMLPNSRLSDYYEGFKFGGSPPPRAEAPPAPEQPKPAQRYETPGTTAPKLVASPTKGGQRATSLVAGSRNSLDVFISPDSPGALIAGITIKPRR